LTVRVQGGETFCSTTAKAGLRCSAWRLRQAFLHKRTAEQAFGLVVFNVVIAPTATPAVGLAQFAAAAGRINRPAELGDIDKGFDHQHRMAVRALPIGASRSRLRRSTLLAKLGAERSGRIRNRLLLVTKLRRRWHCAGLHPIHVPTLEVLGWST
jgi:hypothetical protein